jgi:hypothetical protein
LREREVMNSKIMIIKEINEERDVVRGKEEMRRLNRTIFKDK